MASNLPTETAHAPIGNPRGPAQKRFLSESPSPGSLGNPHKVDARGHHDVPGFKLGAPVPPREPAIRASSELTLGAVAARGLTPEAAAAGASGQVPVQDTTRYPWRATAALKITIPGRAEQHFATGWFISPYAVITAAHAVFPRPVSGPGSWASQIEVIPGLNGFNTTPPKESFVSDTFFCPTGWQADGDPHLDYGVVLLNQAAGSSLGWFGYSTYTDTDIKASLANIIGYPLDPPDGAAPQGRQFYGASQVVDVDASFVYYDLDTRDGESGSCIYRISGEDSFAMAIHTNSFGSDHGVRIIGPVFTNLQNWAAMHG